MSLSSPERADQVGGALAQIVGTYLQILVGWETKVVVRGFATPRTGNDVSSRVHRISGI